MAAAADRGQARSRRTAGRALDCGVHPGELAYEAALHAARPILAAVAPFHDKLRRGMRGRRVAVRNLTAWANAERDPRRPLLWLHAPSVGEALMAQAILKAARERRPDLQSVFTFFSPSAERASSRVGADVAAYMPWDARTSVRQVLDALSPDVIGFVRTEIWPVLGREAHQRGVRVALVNAVLAGDSSRTRRPARILLGPAYRRLDAVGAVSAEDVPRFGLLGVPTDRIRITGDARFDQVWQRVQTLQRDRPLLRSLTARDEPLLVAGSTWPADEEALVTAFVRLQVQARRWRLLIAPHEPTPEHVRALERRLDDAGLSHARLPDMETAAPSNVHAIVVDRVGVLADLYAAANVAWVGGGFGSDGLHSVVEPAALGVPTLYGPRHGNAAEASRLATAGGGFVIANGADLASILRRLQDDTDARAVAGAAARRFVEQHVGGASRNADLLLEYLTP
jgi:3-deoxy-D-manno-octulosonic-acid transferase